MKITITYDKVRAKIEPKPVLPTSVIHQAFEALSCGVPMLWKPAHK